jgi:hypothetical protein
MIMKEEFKFTKFDFWTAVFGTFLNLCFFVFQVFLVIDIALNPMIDHFDARAVMIEYAFFIGGFISLFGLAGSIDLIKNKVSKFLKVLAWINVSIFAIYALAFLTFVGIYTYNSLTL